MKVEIKEIVDQVTDLLRLRDCDNTLLDDDHKVAVCQDEGRIVGWIIVKVDENGVITPTTREFKNLVDLFDNWNK